MTIAYIEDNIMLAKSYIEIFEECGYKIKHYDSPKSFIKDKPSGIKMIITDGNFDNTRETALVSLGLRNTHYQGVPIILLSADDVMIEMFKSMKLPAFDKAGYTGDLMSFLRRHYSS